MLILKFDTFEIQLTDDPNYEKGTADNNLSYNVVYQDEESLLYKSSNHAIKVFKDDHLYKTALVCAVGGRTGVFKNSAVVKNGDIFVCCANKVFSLKIPDLSLNWYVAVDPTTCFGIYEADNALFTHGELQVTRLNYGGKILWEIGVRDIIVNIDDGEPCFILRDNFIELLDFNGNKYKLDFHGNLFDEVLSETQYHYDLIDRNLMKRKWWRMWK